MATRHFSKHANNAVVTASRLLCVTKSYWLVTETSQETLSHKYGPGKRTGGLASTTLRFCLPPRCLPQSQSYTAARIVMSYFPSVTRRYVSQIPANFKAFSDHQNTLGQLWDAYKSAQRSFWTPEEIDFNGDLSDWTTRLNEDERKFLSIILAFFASSDGIVADNLVQQFCAEVEAPEVRCFYGFQLMM